MKNSTARFSALTITLHWFMFVLIVAVYACKELRSFFPKGSEIRDIMLQGHFMLGVTVLLFVVIRLIARFSQPYPPIIPSPNPIQDKLAKVMLLALYVFMIAMPILGYLTLNAMGKAVPFFGMELPIMIEKDKQLAHTLGEIHEFGANAGYVLIGLHTAAGLFHHYIQKDNTLMRMLPWGK